MLHAAEFKCILNVEYMWGLNPIRKFKFFLFFDTFIVHSQFHFHSTVDSLLMLLEIIGAWKICIQLFNLIKDTDIIIVGDILCSVEHELWNSI